MTTPAPQALFSNILVAVDGSDLGIEAARTAGWLAGAIGARLAILTIYHSPSTELGEPNYSKALQKALDEADEVIEKARQTALAAGGPEPETERLSGAPAEIIIRLAKDSGHDLVVIGTHGRGRLGTALMGSVSHAVASGAPCPVMVVGHRGT